MSRPPENDHVPPPPVDLTKPPAARTRPAATGPAWIVVPARVVAVVVVLPLRLVYDLVALLFRGLKRTPRGVGRFLLAAYMALLHPVVRVIGQGAVALWSGLVWLWTYAVYIPLRWVAVVVMLGGLRLFGRGSGRLARWFYSIFVAPVVRLLAAIGSVLGSGLAWLGSGVLRLLELVVARPLVALWAGLVWAAKGVGAGLMFLLSVLVVVPAVALWRYVLRPPLLGLAWLGRTAGTGVAALAAIFAGALVWAWRMLGRLLYWVARILFVIPALFVYRYLLRPIGLAGRFLWTNGVVAPSRWVKDALLVPVGRGSRAVWRVSVRDPARWARRSVLAPVRDAGRDVRLQLRRAFRG
ncbi:hypothetical protein [Actinomadura rugatobispora]|uniref:Integral membrane protein n=1 Tax=Actinomadura rugatobispora TaxID=1994 RepID=A0ABW1A6Y3_9ACTN|nr:hypothetical protein GCM10010200_047740 [Actinomadura rugatobispora]